MRFFFHVLSSCILLGALLSSAACGERNGTHGVPDSGPPHDAGSGDSGAADSGVTDSGPPPDLGPLPDLGPVCPGGICYTVYAHSDHVLYQVDLAAHSLTMVGPFHAPTVGSAEDIITDLAVAPDGTIYVVSHTTLYTASASDGHVTAVGPITSCGMEGVALSFLPDGTLYTGDFHGAFCRIDITTSPPTVTPVATLSGGYALSGDLVAVADGTLYGTVYLLSDPSGMGTQANNRLAQIDPTTGAVNVRGPTGYPKLFGAAYQMGMVFGFTHDGTGHVITMDPHTGASTLFGTFMDPSTGRGISFAGAGVNARVPSLI